MVRLFFLLSKVTELIKGILEKSATLDPAFSLHDPCNLEQLGPEVIEQQVLLRKKENQNIEAIDSILTHP